MEENVYGKIKCLKDEIFDLQIKSSSETDKFIESNYDKNFDWSAYNKIEKQIEDKEKQIKALKAKERQSIFLEFLKCEVLKKDGLHPIKNIEDAKKTKKIYGNLLKKKEAMQVLNNGNQMIENRIKKIDLFKKLAKEKPELKEEMQKKIEQLENTNGFKSILFAKVVMSIKLNYDNAVNYIEAK